MRELKVSAANRNSIVNSLIYLAQRSHADDRRFATFPLAVLVVLPFYAAAQSTAGGDLIEEVVVTAQKRTESIQNVPMSITAITAETMQRADIASFVDYATQVPNL